MLTNSFDYLLDVYVDRSAGLRSYHFLLVGVFDVFIDKIEKMKLVRLDLVLLENEEIREEYCDRSFDALGGVDLTGESIIVAPRLVAK